MAENKNLAERFSNEQYLTYYQIAKELNTTLITGIWDQVIEYRDKFTLPLTLRSVDKSRYFVVLTPKITEKITNIERKLTKLLINYAQFVQNEDYRAEFKVVQTKNILSNIASVYGIHTDENFYQRLVTNNLSSVSPSEMILKDYFRAIEFLIEKKESPLDINFISALADIFKAKEAPNYIFRTQEVNDQAQKALVNRIFVNAPVNRIEEMVEDLLDFIQVSSTPLFVKFVAIFFYFSFIKPFTYHSEEIALLFAKAYLQRSDLEPLAPIINLEVLHDEYKEQLGDVMLEVKKSNDLTYLINFIADVFIKQIGQFEELMSDIKRRMIIAERFQADTPIVNEQPAQKVENDELYEQQDLFTEIQEAVKVSEQPKVEVKVDETTEEVKTRDVNPTYIEPTTLVKKQDEGVKLETWMDIALPKVPVGLSEEDAQKIETHLREMDPSLSRLEAYFYARHCTLGKYYTISQFKETCNCAYETARTSMDHLANSGYYRKEKFKNKFLYTPVKR